MNMPILPQTSGSSNQVTMTSPEIVDFINAHRQAVATIEKPYKELRHDHFMAKVPQVLGEKAAPIFLGTDIYTNGTGGTVQRQIYRLPKREACLMAMSYSYELQAQIFDRMTAMENHIAAQNLPSYAIDDPIERAKKWIEEEKQKQAVIHQLEIAAPKAQALDVLSNSHGTETVDNCAHAMGIQPRKTLRPWMEKNNWIHKDKDGQWRAKSDRIMAGHLKEASRVITDTSGKPRHKVTVYVTPKGKALLTTRLIQAGIIKGVAA